MSPWRRFRTEGPFYQDNYPPAMREEGILQQLAEDVCIDVLER